MSDDAPKSSYELAMERLRKKDAEAGIEQKPLTDAQKRFRDDWLSSRARNTF